MSTATIFYSWQSDTPAKLNRQFIEEALKQAINNLNSDVTLEPAIRETTIKLDKDTQDVPGSPPIAATILKKIEVCRGFVADLTFVGESLPLIIQSGSRKRLFPNPNVLIEYGYALRCHGHDCIVAVLNTAFGESDPENLPFDLRHLRWPIKYHLPPHSNSSQRQTVIKPLVSNLTAALKLVLASESNASTMVLANDFEAHKSLDSDPAVFSEDARQLIPDRPFGLPNATELVDEGRAYLRLYPSKAPSMIKTGFEARQMASTGGLRPMGTDISGLDVGRNVFGAIVYEGPFDGKLFRFTQLFLNKELWGVDAFSLNASRLKKFPKGDRPGFIASQYVERTFTETLTNYLQFANKTLNLPVPLQLEAGLTGIRDYAIAVENGLLGRVLTDHVRWNGAVPSYDIRPHEILRSFFDYMWAECGLARPNNR